MIEILGKRGTPYSTAVLDTWDVTPPTFTSTLYFALLVLSILLAADISILRIMIRYQYVK